MHPGHPLHFAAQSHAYTDLARSVLLLTPDTLSHNPRRRLLIPLKNSFAFPDRAFSLSFHTAAIDATDFPIPYLTFDPQPISDHPLLPTGIPDDAPAARSELEQALTFLQVTLAHGPLPSAQLQSESHSLGIAPRTLARAKSSLRIHSFRTHRWFSALPNTADPEYQI